MYYNSYHRMKRMKELMEKIAYASVGSDILIAASTYLVIKNVDHSGSLLMLSDYLDFLVVAIVIALFLALVAVKSTTDFPKKARMLLFKAMHRTYLLNKYGVRGTVVILLRLALAKMIHTPIALIQLFYEKA
ncbi:MAG: hypothetical protein KGH67_05340 [Candidatus Micrarchaeota archaeon]|nr:hypothetical protein [Candidatus Micrarchaeota archaeon]MDE1859919.1 hypothetical protein [Candidatus Micrarchaeota archaeon]